MQQINTQIAQYLFIAYPLNFDVSICLQKLCFFDTSKYTPYITCKIAYTTRQTGNFYRILKEIALPC